MCQCLFPNSKPNLPVPYYDDVTDSIFSLSCVPLTLL